MTLLSEFDHDMGRGGMKLLQRINDTGFTAFFVGGCVRDSALGRQVKDIDIATSAKPEQIMRMFPEAIPTGIQHGTLTVPCDGYFYEITTFRADADYTDGRRPDAVFFLDDITGDLERRDFTVNAMALGLSGILIDPFGGMTDLLEKRLRAVGNAAERFREDALRMLRCIRIAAEYNLTVEKTTWDQVIHCAKGLSAIAMERVYAELDRMIRGTSPYRALQLLQQSNLLMWAKEPLTISKYMQLTDNVSNVNLSKIGQLEHPVHRWTVWFISMDLHDQELYVNGRALRMPNSVLQHIAKILGVHNLLRRAQHNELRNEWITAMLRFGYKTGYDWLTIATHCFSYTNDSWITPYVQNGSEWTSKMQVTELKQLNIDGVILMSITGRQGGPWLQRILHRLLYETASGMVQNESIFLQKRALELCNLQTEQEGSDVNG